MRCDHVHHDFRDSFLDDGYVDWRPVNYNNSWAAQRVSNRGVMRESSFNIHLSLSIPLVVSWDVPQ